MRLGLWGKAEEEAGPTEVSVVNIVATLGARKAWGWKDNLHLVSKKGLSKLPGVCVCSGYRNC